METAKILSQTEVCMVILAYTSPLGVSGEHEFIRIIRAGNNPISLADFPMLDNVAEVDGLSVTIGVAQVDFEVGFVEEGVDLEYLFDAYGNIYRRLA